MCVPRGLSNPTQRVRLQCLHKLQGRRCVNSQVGLRFPDEVNRVTSIFVRIALLQRASIMLA